MFGAKNTGWIHGSLMAPSTSTRHWQAINLVFCRKCWRKYGKPLAKLVANER